MLAGEGFAILLATCLSAASPRRLVIDMVHVQAAGAAGVELKPMLGDAHVVPLRQLTECLRPELLCRVRRNGARAIGARVANPNDDPRREA